MDSLKTNLFVVHPDGWTYNETIPFSFSDELSLKENRNKLCKKIQQRIDKAISLRCEEIIEKIPIEEQCSFEAFCWVYKAECDIQNKFVN